MKSVVGNHWSTRTPFSVWNKTRSAMQSAKKNLSASFTENLPNIGLGSTRLNTIAELSECGVYLQLSGMGFVETSRPNDDLASSRIHICRLCSLISTLFYTGLIWCCSILVPFSATLIRGDSSGVHFGTPYYLVQSRIRFIFGR